MSPYDELPESEKLKDHLFTAIVAVFAGHLLAPQDDPDQGDDDAVPTETETETAPPPKAGPIAGAGSHAY